LPVLLKHAENRAQAAEQATSGLQTFPLGKQGKLLKPTMRKVKLLGKRIKDSWKKTIQMPEGE
jgi:hypothetical protein